MAHKEDTNTMEFTNTGAMVGLIAYIAIAVVIALPFL